MLGSGRSLSNQHGVPKRISPDFPPSMAPESQPPAWEGCGGGTSDMSALRAALSQHDGAGRLGAARGRVMCSEIGAQASELYEPRSRGQEREGRFAQGRCCGARHPQTRPPQGRDSRVPMAPKFASVRGRSAEAERTSRGTSPKTSGAQPALRKASLEIRRSNSGRSAPPQSRKPEDLRHRSFHGPGARREISPWTSRAFPAPREVGRSQK